jgi:sigma-B regulation protein RsbU (phosphoserine phosphatase)
MPSAVRSALVRSALARLSSIWLREARAFGLRQGDRWVASWPEGASPGTPELSSSVPDTEGLELAIVGVGKAGAARLDADAQALGDLIRSERDGDLLAAELVDRQDQILALYDLARSSRNKLDLPVTLQTVAAEMGRLLKADFGFIVLFHEGHPPQVVTAPPTPLEPGRIGGWLDRIRRTTRVHVGQDASASPSGDHDCFVVAPVRTRNAGIAALGAARSGRPFTTPDVKLVLAIAEQAGALIENAFAHRDKLADAARQAEMQLAAQVQHDLLPRTWPVLPGIQIHAAARPASAVGGDFYDVLPLGTNGLFACLGDVSGKGVPAAIVMAMAHAAFRCALRTSPPEPQWLLRSAVSSLYDDFVALEMFATAFLVLYDERTRTLRYVNAGHAPAIYRPHGGPSLLLDADEPPVGMLASTNSSGHVLRWRPGDLLVVATDGFTDSTAPDGTYYGVDRLADAIARAAQRDAHVIVDALLDDADAFRQGRPAGDDQTVLVLKAPPDVP